MGALFKSTAVYHYQQKINVDNLKNETSILEIKSNDLITKKILSKNKFFNIQIIILIL